MIDESNRVVLPVGAGTRVECAVRRKADVGRVLPTSDSPAWSDPDVLGRLSLVGGPGHRLVHPLLNIAGCDLCGLGDVPAELDRGAEIHAWRLSVAS